MWRETFRSNCDDGILTKTTIEQARTEHDIIKIYRTLRDRQTILERVYLMKGQHLSYLSGGLRTLPYHFETLDASRPWICYWILHSMELMKKPISEELGSEIVLFLACCQHPDGGFCGGPGQLPHLAPTFASVLALCTVGTQEAYNLINRTKLLIFLTQMHQPDGSYIMHKDGETDVRGAYCAIVTAMLTNILSTEIIEKTGEWIASCQTYEGGFSAVPGTEAHGGYTFCAFASLILLNKLPLCDYSRVLKWASRRQMMLEGGFQGRTNKLVDGCYSFWVAGLFPLIYMVLKEKGDVALDPHLWQFDQGSLQEYILFCCQSAAGGLVDKPGKGRDYYHTCYCLSGLSVAQHCVDKIINITQDSSSLLEPVHPAFNLSLRKATQATEHFCKLPSISLLCT